MELKVTRHGAASQVAVLHPGAQVDGRSAFQFEQDVLELLQDGTKYVVVDFAAVNLFASAGIRVLLIRDTTPIPHNGCRPPKRRRV